MNAKELAKKLNGRQIRKEITELEEVEAKENGLVVVFGASDDLMELRGAIYDEVSVCDGGRAFFDEDGLLEAKCEDESCPHEITRQEKAKKIEALWCYDDVTPWKYETEIPHETFEIFEDDELYCIGLVFNINQLKAGVRDE